MSGGPPTLRVSEKSIPLDQIDTNAWNPNEMPEFMAGKLRESLRTFRQVVEIQVREKPDGRFEVIDGEQRLAALKDLGAKEALCNVVDFGDSLSKLMTVAMNEIHGEYDPQKMGEALNELQISPDWKDFEATVPFTEAQLESLSALAYVDSNPVEIDPPVPKGGAGAAPEKAWIDIKVSVPTEDLIETELMISRVKDHLGIEKKKDPALSNGELLKRLLTM